MKKLFFIIAIVFSINTFCQTVTNTELDKFIGTWQWSSGNDTVTIVLEKQVYNVPFTGSNTEMLVGWHRYVKNGALIESSFQYIGRNVNVDANSHDVDFKTTLLGSTRTPTAVYFRTFWDLTLHKNCYLYFRLLSGSTTQATWKLKEADGIYNGPSGTYGKFTLPKSLVLTKQ
jgi:hypothetical protein